MWFQPLDHIGRFPLTQRNPMKKIDKETKKRVCHGLMIHPQRLKKNEQYQLNRGLNVEIDFIQPGLNTEAGTGLVDIREITMT